MSDTCNIRFLPQNVSARVAVGSTLLAAANAAGVLVNSLCGGEGVCGCCRVIVREGDVAGGSTEFFTRREIEQGFILACEARAASDLVVEIPAEAHLADSVEHPEGESAYLADLDELLRYVRLAPLVHKTHLTLPRPSLDDNVCDLRRLEQALAKTMPGQTFQAGLKLTRSLPKVLRDADWDVTVVTGRRGPLTEIIDVVPRDASARNLCIAADIGTTTVVCDLVDLSTSKTLGREAKYNSQAGYGADVIHRIIHASRGPEGEAALRDAIVSDLNGLIQKLVARHHVSTQDITLMTAAGNTTMMHLLLGLPADNIRREPYVGAAYVLPAFRAAEVGLRISPRGLLYCLPGMAGFVGSDTVAGIFSSGMASSPDLRMLIDIGTNGELVVGNSEFLVCASASAGPAFEGAECRSGMRATRGAIDHIRLAGAARVAEMSTIGSAAPVGICGTGYVDLLAEMLRVGVINRTGDLQRESCPSRIRIGPHGQQEYVVLSGDLTGNQEDIAISQGDIHNIIRAKAAIYAAAGVLLHALRLDFLDLKEIMVAGGFGYYLNVENAIRIGLLPDLPPQNIRFIGNTSLAGAKLAAVCDRYYDRMCRIARSATYFELSTDPAFMDQFVAASFLPHTDIELFPSIAAGQAKG